MQILPEDAPGHRLRGPVFCGTIETEICERKDLLMQLFELVSPRLFRPLAGPNRAFYAELLLLLWEE